MSGDKGCSVVGAVLGTAADVLRAVLGREQDRVGAQLPCQVWVVPVTGLSYQFTLSVLTLSYVFVVKTNCSQQAPLQPTVRCNSSTWYGLFRLKRKHMIVLIVSKSKVSLFVLKLFLGAFRSESTKNVYLLFPFFLFGFVCPLKQRHTGTHVLWHPL